MLRLELNPIEDIYISDLRIALINHILSKQLKEDLIIRIKDIDILKNKKNDNKKNLEILNLFSIDYKQVLYQSNNLKYHKQIAMQLLIEKKAFSCFCTKEMLQRNKEESNKKKIPYGYSGICEKLSNKDVLNNESPFVIRIKKPTNYISFKNSINQDIDSFVILKHKKTPTYNFSCAIDDMISDISTIACSKNHFLDTLKQTYIRNLLGYTKNINYVYLPIIINPKTNKKINKNDDISSVKWLISEGYLPAAIANYLVLLTCNNTTNDIFTIEEAIKWFDIKNIFINPVKFDIRKLNLINKDYINNMNNMRLSKILGYSDSDIGKLAKLYLQECNTIKQIKYKIDLIFSKKIPMDNFKEEFKMIQLCLIDAPFLEKFDDLKQYIIKKTNIEGKKLFVSLRFLITGLTSGPSLNNIYPMIKNYLGEITK